MSESETHPEVEPSMNAEEGGDPSAQPEREQFIVLFRHGIAEERTDEKPDEDRSLTEKGHKRMKRISRGLESVLPKVDALYSSPLLRAIQTAMWLRKRYGKKHDVEILDALVPGSDPQTAIAALRGAGSRVVLVGHEPNLSSIMKALVGLPPEAPLELEKGGCYGVRIVPGERPRLEWHLPAKVLRRLR